MQTLALASIYLIWGSTFLAVRYVLEAFPPLAMSGARFAVAGLLLLLYVRKPATLKQWRSALIMGTLLLSTGTGLVAWAEQTVSSGQAALVNATTPMWIALWSFYRRGYPGHATVAGILLASLGLFSLMQDPGSLTIGTLAILFASLSWTAATLLSPQLDKPESSIQFSGMTMLAAGGVLTALSLFIQETLTGPITFSAIAAWLYLVVAGSLIGMTAYTWLLRHSSPSLVATHTYVNPVVAVALSALVGEALPSTAGPAILLILAGVILLTVKTSLNARVFRSYIPLVGYSEG
ncbi:MAG: EamA family transporter [Candidatus Eremiobacteraeota bacterium]|nr:EamA family transporter [Candidatus Eremiobacteraeota bacterium]MCW5866188.1 EamA family transporter [Candidatus Eremiobacteraeota bacterium]